MDRTDTSLGPSGPPDFLESSRIAFPEARKDLILMDIQLPGMDGLVATALLNADPVTAAIPVIVLTASLTKNN